MKDKSLFMKIILLILLGVGCIVCTVGLSILFGAIDTTLFDFSKLNYSNMIPVLIVGVFISCVIMGIAILFVGKTAFLQFRDYLKNNQKNNGGNKQ